MFSVFSSLRTILLFRFSPLKYLLRFELNVLATPIVSRLLIHTFGAFVLVFSIDAIDSFNSADFFSAFSPYFSPNFVARAWRVHQVKVLAK